MLAKVSYTSVLYNANSIVAMNLVGFSQQSLANTFSVALQVIATLYPW